MLRKNGQVSDKVRGISPEAGKETMVGKS